ncbi:phage portal protein [Lysobacter antibioticus]|uniref:phage portal protein n=1 Tax=Lysobacter antibioticus TaxID=84531 RepID=UPI0007E8CB6F|nr:phage portal protein [Lysobacter antibioticus]
MYFISTAWGWLTTGLRRLVGLQIPTPGSRSSLPAKDVNFDTAMQVSAFWACARLISETVASLPVVFYRVQGKQRTPDDSHPLYPVLAMKPNRYQTRVDFFMTLVLNLVTWGNAYAQITKNSQGQIISLLPLMSSQMQVRLLSDGAVIYQYTNSAGVNVFAEGSIWHIKIFGNGIIGLSPLGYATNSIAIAQASEDRVSQVFRNGAKPAGVLMVDGALNREQRAEIRASFADLAEGNNDSLIVLDKFMKYEQVSMSPQDIELLQSRRFQVEDIARFMGVPSVLINDTQSTTAWGSGIQQIIEGWYKLGLRPYLENIELSARLNLLPVAERRGWEIELDFDALLRADMLARYQAYQTAINGGFMKPGEARSQEGWSPADGDDQLLVNSTMVPISQAGRPKQTTAGVE